MWLIDPDYTHQAQLHCLDRELQYRRATYDRRVIAGKMTPARRDWEIGCMQAIRDRLGALGESDVVAS